MNLYLRLLMTILKALRAPRIQAGESIELSLCVLPNDLDINGHMNNARYLSMVDLALMTLFIRSGFARLCIAKRWRDGAHQAELALVGQSLNGPYSEFRPETRFGRRAFVTLTLGW